VHPLSPSILLSQLSHPRALVTTPTHASAAVSGRTLPLSLSRSLSPPTPSPLSQPLTHPSLPPFPSTSFTPLTSLPPGRPRRSVSAPPLWAVAKHVSRRFGTRGGPWGAGGRGVQPAERPGGPDHPGLDHPVRPQGGPPRNHPRNPPHPPRAQCCNLPRACARLCAMLECGILLAPHTHTRDRASIRPQC
jgi:hypothetical protein